MATKVVKRKKKKSFKKVLKYIIRNILLFIISCKDKFMKLKKQVRYIIYIWTVVLVVLLFLILGSSATSKKIEKYETMERNMNDAALLYVSSNYLFPNENKKLVLDLEMLKDNKYVSKDDVPDDTCRGYSLVYYDEESDNYVISSYLNCKSYTTKNYSENKNQ